MRTLLIGQTVVYAGALYGLSTIWYDNLSGFRVFDDADEWLQMDKVGHVYTAYHIARVSARGYRWAGKSEKQAALYGALTGFIFQTPIEIMDGLSPRYGFSVSDVAFNAVGSGLFAGQYALWGEERIIPKFSYRGTPYAAARPALLGDRWSNRWLKDYNGQTYWFSANLSKFAPRATWLPRWLNVAAGYGIEQMVAVVPEVSIGLGYPPYRQYYLSLDVDFTRIPTNRKWVRSLLFLLNTLKVPAPTLEFGQGRVRGHWLYF